MNTTRSNPTAAHAKPRAPLAGLSLALLLAGTLLVGFSMGRWLAPLAAWIGPALLLRYMRDSRGRRSLLLLLVAYTTAFAVGFGPMWLGAGWPLPMIGLLPPFYGLLWCLPYLADRLVGARLADPARTLVYPLAATALEFINIHTNPVGMWGATGFTQYGDLPLMQLASVTGMIGITFLLGWFAAVANWAWENRAQGSQLRRGLAAFGAVLTVVYGFGFLRLNTAPAGETVRVAGITAMSQRPVGKRVFEAPDLATAKQELHSYWQAYFDETVREAQAGAQIVVWDEAVGVAGSRFDADETALLARAQEVARQYRIYLAFTMLIIDSDPAQKWENKLLMIDPTGTVQFEHVKYGGNIVEGTRLGDGKLRSVATPFGVLSGVICWDMDYPATLQQAGQNGTGLMLVPSRDWFEIDPLHAQMAVFRAIENGMSIVRQTDQGLSIATDAYGRALAQVDFFGSTDQTMVAQVPTQHVATVYTAFGRWFEWLCLAGFVLVTAWALFARRIAKG